MKRVEDSQLLALEIRREERPMVVPHVNGDQYQLGVVYGAGAKGFLGFSDPSELRFLAQGRERPTQERVVYDQVLPDIRSQ